jgi:hypothetical protein
MNLLSLLHLLFLTVFSTPSLAKSAGGGSASIDRADSEIIRSSSFDSKPWIDNGL